MQISKLAAMAALAAIAAFGTSQSLPPPVFAGMGYWYGPGPSVFSLNSSVQGSGGYAEMYRSGGNWVAGVNGGPAFSSVSPGGASISSTFNVDTTLNIEPYIYVDGYFGLTANVAGFASPGTLNIGASRFYVLHNCPITLHGDTYTDVTNGSTVLQTVYRFVISNYADPGSFTGDQDVNGGTSETFDAANLSTATTGGVLQVDIQRIVSFPVGVSAGQYTGSGTVSVSSV